MQLPWKKLLALTIGLMFTTTDWADEPANKTKATKKPNIVVIFIDDLGYADIGPFGAKGYATPNLDRMAKEGRCFTDFYVPQGVCSASRAALMTGCYSNRVGILGALFPHGKTGINANETTVAEVCKEQGYATAIFGKWHLGHQREFLPLQHGFDEYFGLPYSNDMWPLRHKMKADPTFEANEKSRKGGLPDLPLIEGNDVKIAAVRPEDQANLTTWYTEHAVDFINRNHKQDKPFFLYVPHSMVHIPLFVSEKFAGKSEQGLFGDVMMEVDWSVGQILDAIRKNGIEDNTLVIFTADNGPWLCFGDHAGSAKPLREGKGTEWDGGVREAMIAWWPGTIPADTKCSEPAMTIDILPTVAALSGGNLPKLKIDGKDIRPLLFGEEGATSPHEALYFYYGKELHAIRSGPWKLHFPHSYVSLNGRPGGTKGERVDLATLSTGMVLYNLDDDIGELKNVAKDNPEVVARLSRLAETARKELGDKLLKREGTENRLPGNLAKEQQNRN